MSRKIFTEEEVAILRQNPYVVTVSPKRIHYSPEFKQLFWKEYNETGNPTGIMRKYGFDPKILGIPRIKQMQIDIKQEIAKGATCYADIRKKLNNSILTVRTISSDCQKWQINLKP